MSWNRLNIKNNLLPSTLRDKASVMLGATSGFGSANRIYNFERNHPKPVCNLSNWTNIDLGETVNSYNWERIAMSYNGKIQTAVVRTGNIYTSTNYGFNWTPSPQNFNLNWYCVSMSNDGKYQTAVPQGDHIYTSSDYGVTWQANLNSPIAWWTSVCVSETGQYQTAVINGYESDNQGFIYVSSDYGVTWSNNCNLNNCWIYVAMSNDGKYQCAVSLLIQEITDNPNLGYVFNSSDYGVTWNKNTYLPQSYYTCCAISGNGQIQLVGINNCNLDPATKGPILISYNYGVSFFETTCPYDNWLNISINTTGNIILAASYQQTDHDNNPVPDTGKMMVSYNSGKNWQTASSILNTWTSSIISKNNCIASGTAWGKGIYIKIN